MDYRKLTVAERLAETSNADAESVLLVLALIDELRARRRSELDIARTLIAGASHCAAKEDVPVRDFVRVARQAHEGVFARRVKN